MANTIAMPRGIMRSVMFVLGILVIIYGVLLVGVSVPSSPLPLTLVVPVPWSSTPATIDNPQLEPGAVLILFGIIICVAAMLV
jgi:hypothetical protein